MCLFSALAALPTAGRAGASDSRALLAKVKENVVVNATCKHLREQGITFLLAAVGCAGVEAVSEITGITCFSTFFFFIIDCRGEFLNLFQSMFAVVGCVLILSNLFFMFNTRS